jgi:hypothetical protein
MGIVVFTMIPMWRSIFALAFVSGGAGDGEEVGVVMCKPFKAS